MIRKAFWQVWSTWNRIRLTYPSREAFLVIFRRGGPALLLPVVVHHDALKLYPVVADIASAAGSRETHAPITFTEQELRPTALADLEDEEQ